MIMKSQNSFMLTGKDVLYLTDILDQTLVLNLRVANDLTMIKDKEVKACFLHVNEVLCESYRSLLAQLEREAN